MAAALTPPAEEEEDATFLTESEQFPPGDPDRPGPWYDGDEQLAMAPTATAAGHTPPPNTSYLAPAASRSRSSERKRISPRRSQSQPLLMRVDNPLALPHTPTPHMRNRRSGAGWGASLPAVADAHVPGDPYGAAPAAGNPYMKRSPPYQSPGGSGGPTRCNVPCSMGRNVWRQREAVRHSSRGSRGSLAALEAALLPPESRLLTNTEALRTHSLPPTGFSVEFGMPFPDQLWHNSGKAPRSPGLKKPGPGAPMGYSTWLSPGKPPPAAPPATPEENRRHQPLSPIEASARFKAEEAARSRRESREDPCLSPAPARRPSKDIKQVPMSPVPAMSPGAVTAYDLAQLMGKRTSPFLSHVHC